MADQSSFLKPILRDLVYGVDAWKKPVKAVATSNISLLGTQTIDGVAIGSRDEVLCVGQSSAPQNGIWVASTGAWTRRTDADASDKLFAGVRVAVTQGTAAGSVYRLMTTGRITVGTTAQTWALDLQATEGTPEDVDPTPDTLALRGSSGEVKATRVELSSSTVATTGHVRGPEDIAIYGRVSTGGGQDARVAALDGTTLRVGGSNVSPRFETTANGEVTFAHGATPTTYFRILADTPVQVGDIQVGPTGHVRSYNQEHGDSSLLAFEIDVPNHWSDRLDVAATTLSERSIGASWISRASLAQYVAYAHFLPEGALVASDTDFAVISLYKRSDSTGADKALIAEARTTITGVRATGDWTAFDVVPLTIVDIAGLAQGQYVTWDITVGGGVGATVPAGRLFIGTVRLLGFGP